MSAKESEHTIIRISNEHTAAMVGIVIGFLITIFMLMWLLININAMKEGLRRSGTEVRILQMQIQDQNAILIRQGLLHPGDLTTGPTNPDKLKVKK